MSLFRHSLPYLAAIAMLASSCGIENNEGLEKELRFHDGVFRIAQVCDIHYGCTETDKLARIREMVTKTVEDESPDLFVFTGDAVTGSDDAHKGWLYLDDKLFIDNDGNHAGEGIFRYLGLEKGFHHIQIKYLENYDGNRVTVKLQGKNYPEMEIPAEWLFFK
ncbi:MAG: metallophosphoesterase [Bacteroidales bacterium]|nr:metallophosphoesterase [Bacteroidales bacterium]